MNRVIAGARYDAATVSEVVAGLGAPQKQLPCKLFYDKRGAELFEEICELPEYYLTRAELSILNAHGDAMADWIGANARIIEFGSGSGEKTRVLLRKLKQPGEYVAIDIAEEQLHAFTRDLAQDLPKMRITPIRADYTKPMVLPRTDERTVIFFPGSTIGNFEPSEAAEFLRHARSIAGARGGLLIGADLQKDRGMLELAYNDAAGITAEFNLNILRHINRVCDADFDIGSFMHRAIYNEKQNRIEMHLVSDTAQVVRVGASTPHNLAFEFAEGESIVTEYSYKYTIAGFQSIASKAGFSPAAVWTDSDHRFSVHAFDVT